MHASVMENNCPSRKWNLFQDLLFNCNMNGVLLIKIYTGEPYKLETLPRHRVQTVKVLDLGDYITRRSSIESGDPVASILERSGWKTNIHMH